MQLRIKNTKLQEGHLVAWDSIEVSREDGQPFDGIIKNITLQIKAGDIGVLAVEEYVLDSTGNVVKSADSAQSSFKNIAVTKITNYPIRSLNIDTGEQLLPPVNAKKMEG